MNEAEMNEKVKDFHVKCGEILRMALAVEGYLDFFLPNYFCQPQSYKTFLLSDSVLLNIGFEQKTTIFRTICIKEGFDKSEIDKIISSIDFVKKIRNRVAHEEPVINCPTDGRIRLQTRKSTKYGRDALELTDELIKQIEKNKMEAINGIVKIHTALLDPNRKIKDEVMW